MQRVGKKHDPSFRVVLTDSRKGPQSGGFLEILGNYNARKGEPLLKGDKIKEYIAKGAQLSDTVNNLLVKAGIIKGDKKDVLHHDRIKKALAKKEGEKPAEEPKEPAPEANPPAGGEEAEPAKEEVKEEPVKEEAKTEEEKQEEPKVEVKEEEKEPANPPAGGEEAKEQEEAKAGPAEPEPDEKKE